MVLFFCIRLLLLGSATLPVARGTALQLPATLARLQKLNQRHTHDTWQPAEFDFVEHTLVPLPAVDRGGEVARPAPLTPEEPRCSLDPEDAVLLPANVSCPWQCPYSQLVEGGSCEKVCLKAEHCGEFHPVRLFANPLTARCETACGDHPRHHIAGCTECAAPGVCKLCSAGLFGLTGLELAEDGRSCTNRGQVWWYVFYGLGAVVSTALIAYLLQLQGRPSENEQVLQAAMCRRENGRTELMRSSPKDRSVIWTPMHGVGSAAEWLGGRGIALYFNWLLFGAIVTLILGAVAFYGFELSDLARQTRSAPGSDDHQASCTLPSHPVLRPPGVAASPSASPSPSPARAQAQRDTQAVFAAAQPELEVLGEEEQEPVLLSIQPSSHRWRHAGPASASEDVGAKLSNNRAALPAGHHAHRGHEDEHGNDNSQGQGQHRRSTVKASFRPDGKKKRNAVVYWMDAFTDYIGSVARKLGAPVQAPPTRSIQEKYQQFHSRMFRGSIVAYVSITLLTLVYAAFQLHYVSSRFDTSPSTAHFAALVTNVPKELIDGRRLTKHFREALDEEDFEDLWSKYSSDAGTRKSTGGMLAADAPLEDRFHVVGTSIAYDFYEHQNHIQRDIDSWIQDLEGWGSSSISPGDSSPSKSEHSSPTTSRGTGFCSDHKRSRGVQTDTRGDILGAMQQNLRPIKESNGFLADKFLLKVMGLPEEHELVLRSSGKAFVVFGSQAARDAVVELARQGQIPPLPFTNRRGKRSFSQLTVEPAPCEPVSVRWENFASWVHFPQKIMFGVLLMVLTMFLWVLLYLPYAAFYADLAVIPGLAPSMFQDVILGVLIAVGNAVLSVVIDKVTDWAGFLYKDNRDQAVLALAFLGTLLNTVTDLAMVAMVARGVMLEEAFRGRDTGYDAAVADELFTLIVPGYILVPYAGGPILEHLVPYWLAKALIRTHARVKLQHATSALKCPDFDICWRYSDILNNTTVCTVLLFLTSARAWQVMCWLFAFMVLIYFVDKYLLLHASTTTVYDTHRLSTAFARWWCMPTSLLAGLACFWGLKAGYLKSFWMCFALPLLHLVLFLLFLLHIESYQDQGKDPRLYPRAVRELRETHRPWDFFNTNPVFCLRTRALGPSVSGWSDVVDYVSKHEGLHALGPNSSDECVPFYRGSVWLVSSSRRKV